MNPKSTTIQNLLIAAAELHYLAAEEADSEARARKTVLALDLEKIALDHRRAKKMTSNFCDDEKHPKLKLVHDAGATRDK